MKEMKLNMIKLLNYLEFGCIETYIEQFFHRAKFDQNLTPKELFHQLKFRAIRRNIKFDKSMDTFLSFKVNSLFKKGKK
jgi:hypothetical protein